ncbi:MAG TPA: Xaa-Pro aminopeptidase [Burkholderiales bacterium]|nr:Xaa-Pro aminopeptidase [Burkholderiales bacterium]
MVAQIYLKRREWLARNLGQGLAVLPTAPERPRNRDSYFPYRFDSTFYYLTGFEEPEAVLVIVGGNEPQSILFCREKDLDRETWDGLRYGPDAAQIEFGFDAAWPIDLLDQKMAELICQVNSIYTPLGESPEWDSRMMGWINTLRNRSRSGLQAPSMLCDLRQLTDEMRLIKDESEIMLMRKAADISSCAHRRAMSNTWPGRMEFEIGAEIIYEFARQGAQSPAYTSIVAGGKNACILHYIENDAQLRAGDLLLIDAGCEYAGYAADITRSFPVNGRFEGAGRAVYEVVLEAQIAAIEAVKPGASFNAPHEAALKILTRGLVDLGLLKGEIDILIEAGEYRKFYMHRTSHWLGLDVHDVGEYKKGDEWRTLLPNMVLTIEPGLYIRESEDTPSEFWNIGVRIEDDVMVTPSGYDVLTAEAPKSIAEIEALMASHD